MPIVNGEKYACVSCVRGHRVSACSHNDRELKLIPPKGRPVKQCDHCRTARKSKSHHGKCDCGSKKDKKDLASPIKECCCQDGKSCRCNSKNDSLVGRLERSLKRPNVPVKCKPTFSRSQSDDKLAHAATGPHGTLHRMNSARTASQPYPIHRPRSEQGADADFDPEEFVSKIEDDDFQHTSMTIPEAEDGEPLEEIVSYDFDKHFASASQEPTPEEIPADVETQIQDWEWPQVNADTVNGFDLSVDAANFNQDAVFPFSPADLPLISPQVSNFNQTISHSSDFTNETAWTADNYMVDGQIAVQDDWPLDDVLDGSFSQTYSKLPAFTAAPTFPVASPLAESPAKTAMTNSMVIPVDPESPGDKPEDWWPSSNFTSGSADGVQLQQPELQSRTHSMDASNYDGNYDWAY